MAKKGSFDWTKVSDDKLLSAQEGAANITEAAKNLSAPSGGSMVNELMRRGLSGEARQIRDREKARRKNEKSKGGPWPRTEDSSGQQAESRYYHDDEGGFYIFYFGKTRRPKIISEDKWKRVCWMYPAAGEGKTVAQIATELDIPAPDLRVMLRLYSFDKHGAPYTHEDLKKRDPDTLAEESLEVIRKKFHVARQRREKAYTMRELSAAREELEERKKTLSDLRDAAGEVMAAAGAPRPGGAVHASPGGDFRTSSDSFRSFAPISDVHGGKFSWAEETWGGNYDTKIAARTLTLHGEAWADFVSSQPGRCTEMYACDLGDFFNGLDLQTQNGTPQEQDGRAMKVWETMLAAEIAKIELLREVSERVILRRVPGNHDGIFAQFFHTVLRERYREVEDVAVEAHPRKQDAFLVARSLYVLDHGDGLPGNLNSPKAKNDALRVARNVGDGREAKQADFVYFFCGHLHEESRATEDNMRMYRLPAACDQSDWEAKGRYSAEPGARMWILDALGRPDLEKPVYFRELLEAESKDEVA